MSANYIVRLDDACPTMNIKKYTILKSLALTSTIIWKQALSLGKNTHSNG